MGLVVYSAIGCDAHTDLDNNKRKIGRLIPVGVPGGMSHPRKEKSACLVIEDDQIRHIPQTTISSG